VAGLLERRSSNKNADDKRRTQKRRHHIKSKPQTKYYLKQSLK